MVECDLPHGCADATQALYPRVKQPVQTPIVTLLLIHMATAKVGGNPCRNAINHSNPESDLIARYR